MNNLRLILLLIITVLLVTPSVQAASQYQDEKSKKRKAKKKKNKKKLSKKEKTTEKKKKAVKKSKKSKFLRHFNGHMNLGLGYDSNVYSTPSSPYVDYSTATYEANGVLTPITYNGAFTYVDFLMEYDHRINKKLFLLADYKYKGRLYFGNTLKNADNYHQTFDFGALYKFKNTNIRKRHLKVQAFKGEDYTIYFDHDDGDHKLNAAGVDVSNRNQYVHTGVKTNFYVQQRKWEYNAKFLYEFLNYPTPSAWSELDHHHFYLLANAKYSSKKGHKTLFGYKYSVRNYLYRGSYAIVAGKPKLITVTNDPTATRLYTYHDLHAKYNYKLSKNYRALLGYKYTYRIDGYAGYNTSHKNQITADLRYKFNKKVKSEFGLLYAYTDFPTAWAFDREPTDLTLLKGDKYYSKIATHLKASYRQSKKFSYELDFQYKNYNSSDDRYIYDRFLSILSMKYKF